MLILFLSNEDLMSNREERMDGFVDEQLTIDGKTKQQYNASPTG